MIIYLDSECNFHSEFKFIFIMNVLYGSETGTAKDISESLAYKLYKHEIPQSEITISSIDNFNFNDKTLTSRPFIFILATCGQGDPPKNMKNWYNQTILNSLIKSTPIKYYTILGLGDSSYTKFNQIAKVVNRRLESLGAELLVECGFADEKHVQGSDAVIVPWVSNLLEELDLEENADIQVPEVRKALISESENWNVARVSCFERVTSENHWQDTRIMKLKIENGEKVEVSKIHTCLIQPKNTVAKSKLFCSLFPYSDDKLLEKAMNVYDLSSCPRSYFFTVLSWFADELYKEKFEELAKYPDNRYEYVNRPRRTVLEVLQDFQSTAKNVPREYLDELLDVLKPREYSIAGFDEEKQEVEFLVAMVEYETRLPEPRIGCLSEYFLVEKPEFVKFKLLERPDSFKLPESRNVPSIYVGPGTGLAPMRFMIQKEVSQKKRLYFGCRGEKLDFYYEDELSSWSDVTETSQKEVCSLCRYVAFSREPKKHDTRKYVQKLIEEDTEALKKILVEENGMIYVAGNSKNMPNDVMKAFDKVLEETGLTSEKLKLENRYIEETWG